MNNTRRNQVRGNFWGKAIWAGIIGGLAMAMYEMLSSIAQGMGFWLPVNMIGAAFPAFRPPPEGLAFGPTLMGLLLHLLTSAFWGFALGAIAARFPRSIRSGGNALALGLAWGIAVWLVMGLFIGPAVNPVMRLADPVHYFIGHLFYGVVSGLVLWGLARGKVTTDRSQSDISGDLRYGGTRP